MSPDASNDGSPSPEPGSDQDMTTMAEEKTERASTEEDSPPQPSSGSAQAAKSNSKDPSRPRRKKARRACFACQRAHLTCGKSKNGLDVERGLFQFRWLTIPGDERPCLRCIKRGLQNQCHDGVRKKAKYLHDAPPGALGSGYPTNYDTNGSQNIAPVSVSPVAGPNNMPVSQPGSFYPATSSSSFQYGSVSSTSHMGPPLMDNSNMVSEYTTSPGNVDNNSQYQPLPSQQISQVPVISNAIDQTASLGTTGGQSFDPRFFDINDPSMYNFNISDLNFGNRYGALEFGMLGHMSSGAVNTPELDAMNSMGQSGMSYDTSNNYSPGYGHNQAFSSWQSIPNTNPSSNSNAWGSPTNGLDAYAIGEHAPSLTDASPHSQNIEYAGFSPTTVSHSAGFVKQEPNQQQNLMPQTTSETRQQAHRQAPFPGETAPEMMQKRRRNTSEIYSSIQAPYSYTQGFHALTAFLQKRYPSKKVLRIAKALAKIRPSFISCNKNLNHDDLIFMEKCFQRTLCEYEDFVNHYGTPTIICRRTGEIAAVSKEFCMVTGWRKDILLGKEANLNVNTGDSLSGTETGTSSRGGATPRIPNLGADPGRPQPVFLAELLDEDSVVQFYEDFAELAFGASRTSIIGAPCSLLKYRTKNDPGWSTEDRVGENGKRMKMSGENKSGSLTRGDAGMKALGQKDGRVECQMCWTVRRDVFDIPMLIVMNVSFFCFRRGHLFNLTDFSSCLSFDGVAINKLGRLRKGVRDYMEQVTSRLYEFYHLPVWHGKIQ